MMGVPVLTSRLVSAGLTHAIMRVRLFPPRESWTRGGGCAKVPVGETQTHVPGTREFAGSPQEYLTHTRKSGAQTPPGNTQCVTLCATLRHTGRATANITHLQHAGELGVAVGDVTLGDTGTPRAAGTTSVSAATGQRVDDLDHETIEG
jgi:hypothetical protein